MRKRGMLLALVIPLWGLCGCNSPYHADRGALFGGLTGAGVGALIGDAVGNPLAGTAIGAGVGTMTGAVVGANMDEMEARHQAEMAAMQNRSPIPGPVSNAEIVEMARAGVSDETIVNHIRGHGVARVLSTDDVLYLKQSGVSERVIQALQQAPVVPVVATAAPGTQRVVVEEHHYHDPWGPPRWYWGYRHRRHHHHHPPGFSWGVSVSN